MIRVALVLNCAVWFMFIWFGVERDWTQQECYPPYTQAELVQPLIIISSGLVLTLFATCRAFLDAARQQEDPSDG